MSVPNGTLPIPYVPQNTPTDPVQTPRYLRAELAKLRAVIERLNLLTVQVADAAPRDPIDGMVRLSVSPWRPVFAQASDRLVVYHGGAWVYLSTL